MNYSSGGNINERKPVFHHAGNQVLGFMGSTPPDDGKVWTESQEYSRIYSVLANGVTSNQNLDPALVTQERSFLLKD